MIKYDSTNLKNYLDCKTKVIERLSMTFTATANGKNKTFAVCLQLSVQ